jgi:hypothetical protein
MEAGGDCQFTVAITYYQSVIIKILLLTLLVAMAFAYCALRLRVRANGQ